MVIHKVAIQIEHLAKKYRLGIINNGTLFRDIQTWIAYKQGKTDPHAKIGENKYGNTRNFFWALKDINLTIKQGDRVGIIGKNGAGKSTLLKILSHITSPTEGKIKINGKIASLLEVGTGFNGELTGRENIYLNGAILGMKRRQITQKFDEIIAFSSIEHHIDTPVKRYSSGMYVRLAFAVAAHLDSDILIADEVLAVGDAEFQKKALGKMQNLSMNQGRTILFVSHNIAAVKNLCKTGILLEEGQINFVGDIEETISQYSKVNVDIISTSLSKRKDRQGNGLFKFISIFFLDKNNHIISEIYTGEFIKIKLQYEKHDSINMNNMIINVIFRDEYQNIIIHFPSDELGIRFKDNKENTIILNIPKIMLRGSLYSITLFSSYIDTDPINLCDQIENAAFLTICSSDLWNSGTIIRNGNQAIVEGFYQ